MTRNYCLMTGFWATFALAVLTCCFLLRNTSQLQVSEVITANASENLSLGLAIEHLKNKIGGEGKAVFLASCNGLDESTMSCVRVGTKYGGYEIPIVFPYFPLIDETIVYHAGCGEDISFDVTFAALTGFTVHLFDPTPRAVLHVNAVKQALETQQLPAPGPSGERDKYVGIDGSERQISGTGIDAQEWFQRVLNSGARSEQLVLHDWGFSAETGNAEFHHTDSISVSMSLRRKPISRHISVAMKTVKDTMEVLGHTHLEFLKLDIEGAEKFVVPQFIQDGIHPKHVCIDMHNNRAGVKKALESAGYVLFSATGQDASFLDPRPRSLR
eukprot:GHVN01007608.1.p1 GENE.GHVN01007608.1~~GHVN01007608.1.p1  ORF type:complete len:328 (+),score=19.54 GHVN01007608.1:34-1017(+)